MKQLEQISKAESMGISKLTCFGSSQWAAERGYVLSKRQICKRITKFDSLMGKATWSPAPFTEQSGSPWSHPLWFIVLDRKSGLEYHLISPASLRVHDGVYLKVTLWGWCPAGGKCRAGDLCHDNSVSVHRLFQDIQTGEKKKKPNVETGRHFRLRGWCHLRQRILTT